MLSCADCDKYVLAFLDGALEVKESLDVDEHLRGCAACAERVEAERSLRTFVRRQALTPPLSEHRKRQMLRQAMRAAPAPLWGPTGRLAVHLRDAALGGLAAAALVLLLLNPFARSSSGDDVMQRLVQETAMTYTTYTAHAVPPEVVSTDDRTVSEWLRQRMGYRFQMPCITDKNVQLLGGRLCRLLDRKTAAVLYRYKGDNLLILAFESEPFSLPARQLVQAGGRAVAVHTVAGRPVVIWHRQGITYSMVGDLDRDALLNMAASVDYR